MAILNRGKTVRLKDREEKKKREVRRYKPPRPLSWLSCVLLLFFALALLYYGGSILLMRFAGTETEALSNTRLDENGEVRTDEVLSRTNYITYTYRDGTGTLHQGRDSLIGNEDEFHETIPVRYFNLIPSWSMLGFRTKDLTTPLLCLFLAVILLFTGINRLLFLRRKALGLLTEEEAKAEEAREAAAARDKK